MREDGAKIDRLLPATDVEYDPQTSEPEESPHQPLALTADLNPDGAVEACYRFFSSFSSAGTILLSGTIDILRPLR